MQDERIIIKHIKEIPDEWLGKSHAMHRGAETATGEIFLFTDGDTSFNPGILKAAAAKLMGGNLDHLSVSPMELKAGYWANSLFSYYAMMGISALRPSLVPSPKTKSAAGIGAFNMIRKEVYRKTGGFGSSAQYV